METGTATTHKGQNPITKRNVMGYLTLKKITIPQMFWIKKLIVKVSMDIRRVEI